MFATYVHLEFLRKTKGVQDRQLRLFHKVQTIRLVNEELKAPKRTSDDELVLAILALGTCEGQTFANQKLNDVESPFKSPLKSSQWFDLYGSKSFVKEHM